MLRDFLVLFRWLVPCFFLLLPITGKSLPMAIDQLLEIPTNWEITPDAFEKEFQQEGNNLFTWLTEDRTRAKLGRRLYRNLEIDLTAFEGAVPIEEVIVDFVDGKINLVTVSIFNRGDGGAISAEDFSTYFKTTGKAMSEHIGTAPRRKNADSQSGLLTEGYSWYSQKNGSALLEYNEKAMDGADREFLRLRVARLDAKGTLAASMLHSRGGTAARLRDLPENVVRDENGDVYIANLPMVDQGDKGYCVAATTQRAFEYYGIGADMHQIAQIAESDPEAGTNTLTMAKELGRIDYRFKTRLQIIGMGSSQGLSEVIKRKGEFTVGRTVDERKFLKEIRSSIDSGLPMLWGLELGRYPEEPQLTPQTAGGHMRMIIGYNDTTERIIFSDSWGAGHEFKKMKMSDAYQATHGLFVLRPTVH